MSENTDPKNKQEFLTMIGHSLEVLEDGLISDANKQSIRNGILETISKLIDQRDEVTTRADAAETCAIAVEMENKRLRDALERFAKIDLTGPIGDAIAWDILNARAALQFEPTRAGAEKIQLLQNDLENAITRFTVLEERVKKANDYINDLRSGLPVDKTEIDHWRSQCIAEDIAFGKGVDAAEAREKVVCHWKQEDCDQNSWSGECGVEWVFSDDGPIENENHFCPNCGKKLIVLEEVSEK